MVCPHRYDSVLKVLWILYVSLVITICLKSPLFLYVLHHVTTAIFIVPTIPIVPLCFAPCDLATIFVRGNCCHFV